MLAEKMAEVDEKIKKEIQRKIRAYNRRHPDDMIDPDSIEVDPICEMFEEMPHNQNNYSKSCQRQSNVY